MKILKKRKRVPQLEYWTNDLGILQIDSIRPQPLKNFIPDWWKSISPLEANRKTVKHCPSFTDVFSSAYVVPMWCDLIITQKDELFYWESPSEKYQNEFHSNLQFLKHSPHWIKKQIKTVLKPVSPWFLKTSPGYSVYQLPVFYDFNEDFSAMPGIIHTDVYNIINPQILIYSDKEQFMIKRGTPLFIHFPFKRDRFDLSVRCMTDEDQWDLQRSFSMLTTKFQNGYRSVTKTFLR